jgi:hypothetical protein
MCSVPPKKICEWRQGTRIGLDSSAVQIIMDAQGRKNQHSIAIVEDESWEIIPRAKP